MKDPNVNLLDLDTRDRFILIVESSLDVSTTNGFFLWTQGALQGLVPHEILICSVSSELPRTTETRWFSSSRYFQEAQFQTACDTNKGLVPRLMGEWLIGGRPHFLMPGNIDKDTEQCLADLEMRNLIGHGVRGGQPNVAGYFCFCRTTLVKNKRTERVLDLLIPHLYSVFCRVLAAEAGLIALPKRTGLTVTARETEILHWIKKGKTTGDIALELQLSPFTVKNHVTKIFRKLGAKSRSQAVANAIYQGILTGDA
jgi:transcriptional regulator EpsA